MLAHLKYDDRLARLAQDLQRARTVTPGLLAKIIAEACTRVPALDKAGKADRITQLSEAGAWADAALALIELELPAWSLRRLVYEDGEWLCSLTRQPHLPASLDDTADASHDVLPLAILCALVEARQRSAPAPAMQLVRVPQRRPASEHAVCCDNFA